MKSAIGNDGQDDIIKMKIMTMNCGNGPSRLSQSILHELQNNGIYYGNKNYLDVLVINAQEIDFKKEFDSLNFSAFGYNTVMLNKKITRTKRDDINVLRGNTGICTYVIYKKYKFASHEMVKSKFLTVANPNKGMLVQTFTLSLINEKNTKLIFQTTSAHLDSYSQEKRLMEMRQGYKYSFPNVSDFNELAAITPDCRFYGGDQNTRLDLGSSENPYLKANTLETKALSILGFGVITTTNTPTYDKVLNEKLQKEFKKLSSEELRTLMKKHKESSPEKESFDDYLRTELRSRILETEANAEVSDKKRMGKQPTGYLDISMHITGKDEDVSVKTVKAFDVTGAGLRDHAAVMSQLIEFQPHANELEKVKGHLLTKMKLFDQSQGVDATKGVYQRLKNALASADNDEKTQQDILVSYYNRYVVELPLQYFDAMLISDFNKKIQAQELITRSRILDLITQELITRSRILDLITQELITRSRILDLITLEEGKSYHDAMSEWKETSNTVKTELQKLNEEHARATEEWTKLIEERLRYIVNKEELKSNRLDALNIPIDKLSSTKEAQIIAAKEKEGTCLWSPKIITDLSTDIQQIEQDIHLIDLLIGIKNDAIIKLATDIKNQEELLTSQKLFFEGIDKQKTDLLEAYELKNEGTENEPKYPYPFDCSEDIQTRLKGTNPNMYNDIETFLQVDDLPPDIKCYFEERLKTLKLFEKSVTLNGETLQTNTEDIKNQLNTVLAPPPRKTKLESRDIWFYEGLVAFATKLIAKALSVLRQAFFYTANTMLNKTLPNLNLKQLQFGLFSWFIALVNKYYPASSAHAPEFTAPTNRIQKS